MTQTPDKRPAVERALENGLFLSRWLMAPFYVGLVIALGMLLVVFVEELAAALPHVLEADSEEIILMVLTLIDLSLAGNLVLIIVFSGYENFVSKINIEGHEDRPSWMGTLDFSGLKIKLVGSIVAISAISLLRAFMELTQQAEMSAADQTRIFWLVMLHLTFVTSGVLFAVMDWVASFPEKHTKMGGDHPPI
jgi:uncharacterized protein (TIGR00645 family)